MLAGRVNRRFVAVVVILVVSLLIVVVIGVRLTNTDKRKPVGTPAVYTTFITSNATAQPDSSGNEAFLTQIPECSSQMVLQSKGMFVFSALIAGSA